MDFTEINETVETKPITIFSAKVSFCFRDKQSGMMTESSHTIDFVSKNVKRAAKDAKTFAEDRLDALYTGENSFYQCKEAFIGCIKLFVKRIGPITDGRLNTFSGPAIFEWKCDHPWTLNQAIRRLS